VLVTKDNPTTNTATTPQLAEILRACGDRISIEILNAIETASALNIRTSGPYLRQELGIGKKQFYSRIQKMIQQRVVKHGGKGNYVLTTFGKIITGNVFSVINTCIENSTGLELIDSIINANVKPTKYSGENNITELVKKLIDNPVLRDIVQEVTKKEYERGRGTD
jgi:hypothetical protein